MEAAQPDVGVAMAHRPPSGPLLREGSKHHITFPPCRCPQNFMDLPKIKVPLILGIWGGKGQGERPPSCTAGCSTPAG